MKHQNSEVSKNREIYFAISVFIAHHIFRGLCVVEATTATVVANKGIWYVIKVFPDEMGGSEREREKKVYRI